MPKSKNRRKNFKKVGPKRGGNSTSQIVNLASAIKERDKVIKQMQDQIVQMGVILHCALSEFPDGEFVITHDVLKNWDAINDEAGVKKTIRVERDDDNNVMRYTAVVEELEKKDEQKNAGTREGSDSEVGEVDTEAGTEGSGSERVDPGGCIPA